MAACNEEAATDLAARSPNAAAQLRRLTARPMRLGQSILFGMRAPPTMDAPP